MPWHDMDLARETGELTSDDTPLETNRIDTHVSPPIKRKNEGDVNKVYDRYGQSMGFYKDVPGILLELKQHPEIHVAVASRTSAPDA